MPILLLTASANSPAFAQAALAPQTPPELVLLFADAPVSGSSLSELVGDGQLEPASSAQLGARAAGMAPGALAPLREVDRLLAIARTALGELDEKGALRALAQAQSVLSGALSLPLSAAFYAEVQLQIAVVAAQAGNWSLAEAALRHAGQVSPRRKLLLGEASPELVALSTRVWRELASAPEGEFRVEVDAPSARVFLDDVDLGPAPLQVRAKVGQHALRLHAPGRGPYGVLVEIEQGHRPAQHYILPEDPAVVALSSLQSARARDDFHGVTVALEALRVAEARPVRALLVESRGPRSIVIDCQASGCAGPLRMLRGLAVARLQEQAATAVMDGGRSLRQARAWLRGVEAAPGATASASGDPPTPLFRRWYVWSALSAVALSTAVVIAVAAAPEPARQLHVVVDPRSVR